MASEVLIYELRLPFYISQVSMSLPKCFTESFPENIASDLNMIQGIVMNDLRNVVFLKLNDFSGFVKVCLELIFYKAWARGSTIKV